MNLPPVLSPIMIWVPESDGRTTFSQLPATLGRATFAAHTVAITIASKVDQVYQGWPWPWPCARSYYSIIVL